MGGSGGDDVKILATFLRAEDADTLLGAVVDRGGGGGTVAAGARWVCVCCLSSPTD